MSEVNQELLKEVSELGAMGLSCSQVTFSYAAKKLGLDEKTARKIGAGFGGGMYNGERCGAVTGSLMGLGLKYGSSCKEDMSNQATLQAKKAEFEAKFKEKYGSLICQEIIGASYGDPEGVRRIKEENLIKGCGALTTYACQILDELL